MRWTKFVVTRGECVEAECTTSRKLLQGLYNLVRVVSSGYIECREWSIATRVCAGHQSGGSGRVGWLGYREVWLYIDRKRDKDGQKWGAIGEEWQSIEHREQYPSSK